MTRTKEFILKMKSKFTKRHIQIFRKELKSDLHFVLSGDSKCYFGYQTKQGEKLRLSYFVNSQESELELVGFDETKKVLTEEVTLKELLKYYKPEAYVLKMPFLFKGKIFEK